MLWPRDNANVVTAATYGCEGRGGGAAVQEGGDTEQDWSLNCATNTVPVPCCPHSTDFSHSCWYQAPTAWDPVLAAASVGVLSPPPPRPAPGPDTPPQTDGAPVSIGHADQRSPDLRGCAGAGKTRTMLPGVATCSHPRHTSRPGHCHQAATNINTEWISIFCTWILIDDLHNSFRKTQNCSTRY